MEWTATRSGKHAVVGYNGHGDVYHNHPASGFRFIVDEIACSQITPASGKRLVQGQRNGGFTLGGSAGVGGNATGDSTICITFIDRFASFKTRLVEAARMLSSCPPSANQATNDHRFIQQPNTNCYVSILPEGVTGLPLFCVLFQSYEESFSFTRQCCYNSR